MSRAMPWSWRDQWLGWRDRWLASARFRRVAASFPLTRPIARRRALQLFDLVAGFVYSQVLLACVRLRLFDLLAQGPLPITSLAQRLALPLDATQRLIDAAVSLRLVQARGDGRFGLGELGAPMVGNQAVAAMVEHHAALYDDLRDPVALLRGSASGGALAHYWPYAACDAPAGLSEPRVADYSALMSASQPLVADEILDAYDVSCHDCLLDVGGGEGVFLTSAAERAPRLRLMLFDLPAVAERARSSLGRAGLNHRAQVSGGDFRCDRLPAGADLVTLIRVVHDHDDSTALALLRAVRRVLPPDGTLLLAEPMAETASAPAMGNAYFGFYLLAMGRGRPRSAGRLSALMREAGFEPARLLRTRFPLQTQVLCARVGKRPASARRTPDGTGVPP